MNGLVHHRAHVAARFGIPFALALIALLEGCASGPSGAGPDASKRRDGAPSQPQSNLDQVPDAMPRVEAVRAGGPNKPYNALGRWYTPMSGDEPFDERGLASWYGTKFHGQSTSSGEPYDMYAMTAAHPTLPIPSYARVRNPANGREIIVRINDRGPFHPGRIVDLSYTGAWKLGLLRGVAPVELERITFAEIRADSWRRTPAQEQTRLAQRALPSELVSVQGVSATSNEGSAAGSGAARPATTQLAVASPVVPATIISPVDLPMAPPLDAPTAAPRETARDTTDNDPVLSVAESPRNADSTPSGFWVQIGAFRQRQGAQALQRRAATDADWIGPLLSVIADQALFRVQAGPYSTQDDALRASRRLGSALGLVPTVVERR